MVQSTKRKSQGTSGLRVELRGVKEKGSTQVAQGSELEPLGQGTGYLSGEEHGGEENQTQLFTGRRVNRCGFGSTVFAFSS